MSNISLLLVVLFSAMDCHPVAGEPEPRSSPKAASVCDLFRNLRRHDGKMVRVTGRLIYSREVLALYEEGCARKFKTSGYTWPSMIALAGLGEWPAEEPAPAFEAAVNDRASLDAAVEDGLKRTPRPPIWVTITGELRLKKKYRIADTHYGRLGDGYGHLGAAPALLIISRVEKVTEKQPP